jgi:hypothetical protein
MFKLRFPKTSVPKWAERYSEYYDDSEVIAIGQDARTRGYLTGEQFRRMARWKTARSRSRCLRNSEEYVNAVTGSSLGASEPRFKIEALRLLDGVDWPTASVILHFCDEGDWPIIDYRAFWSLGQKPPAGRYSFSLWEAYTDFTRRLSREIAADMRTIDRALWSFSRVHQNDKSGEFLENF